MAIRSRIAGPTNRDEASQIVDYLISNLQRNHDVVRDSVADWDQQACHLFAQALKSSYYYDHGHVLGQALRNLANNAIMREHRLAFKSSI